MNDLRNALEYWNARLTKDGITSARRYRNLLSIGRRFVVSRMAREAFDRGFPINEGPVWFESESWKTPLWKDAWEWQKAFREGEAAGAAFKDSGLNPYHKTAMPFSSRLLRLEVAWIQGFKHARA